MSVVWYGFYIPWYGGIGMELIYHCGMGYPLGALNQGIDVCHGYPKMGDWSDWLCGIATLFSLWLASVIVVVNSDGGG